MTWFVRSEKRHMDMVRFKSPKLGIVGGLSLHGLQMGVTNHLLSGVILQVSTPPNATLHPGERADLIKA